MRPPDFIIGDPLDPYLLRWYLIPRNKIFNIYLHKFCKSDDDRALHDHPWLFNMSLLLKGDYIEHKPGNKKKFRWRWIPYFRWGKAPHRVELLQPDPYARGPIPVWTLFVTGPVVREWGFYCPGRWVPWRKFVQQRDGGNGIGQGCEEED